MVSVEVDANGQPTKIVLDKKAAADHEKEELKKQLEDL